MDAITSNVSHNECFQIALNAESLNGTGTLKDIKKSEWSGA